MQQGASFLEAEDETDSFENTSFSKVRSGLAKDEAFCFMYRENLELLSDMGAELVFFSPIHDRHLPKDLDGLIFYGGYPELYGMDLRKIM